MRYAVIESGQVVAIIETEDAPEESWVQSDTAQVGDLWDGEFFTAPAPPAVLQTYVVVVDGVVTNRVLAWRPLGDGWIASETARIGDLWDGETFTTPEPAPAPVPQSVTRRQAKQALLLAGLLSNVQPAIDAIPDATARALAQIEWDESLNFERQRPILIALATALGLDDAALDSLFVTAAGL